MWRGERLQYHSFYFLVRGQGFFVCLCFLFRQSDFLQSMVILFDKTFPTVEHLTPVASVRVQRQSFPLMKGSVANSESGGAAACVPGRGYVAMPKIVWMNWRCDTGSPLATQRT
jgi:hypothetical protein